MPARRARPACVFVYDERVYFRDADGEHWRVYDIVVAPDERSRERRFPLMPPDNRAIYREFISKSGERREYTFSPDATRGLPLGVQQLTRQLKESKVRRKS